jgi:hypothetical protein
MMARLWRCSGVDKFSTCEEPIDVEAGDEVPEDEESLDEEPIDVEREDEES